LFLNILFVVVGLVLIGIGIYIKIDNDFASLLDKFASEADFNGQALGFLAWIMIGGGIVTLLIALFGCIGTLWHNRCLLYMYAFVLLILMILELTAFIMAFVYKGKLSDLYDKTWSETLSKALDKNQTKVLKAFHDLEDAVKCCGVHNVSDYYINNNNITYNYTLSDYCKENGNSAVGCAEKIIGFLTKNLPIVGGTLGGVLLLELFGLIGAIALAVALKHAPNDDYSSRPGDVLGGLVPRSQRRYK